MSPAVALIPTFAAITLLLGSFNELSVRLALIGILGIILHTATTPTDPSGPYPNFDNYPTQPPFRDYVLVFGLASLALVALFFRVRPLVGGLILSYLKHVLTSVRRLRSSAHGQPALKFRVRHIPYSHI